MYEIEISDEDCNEFRTKLPKIPEEGDTIFYWWYADSDPEYKVVKSINFLLKKDGSFDCVRLQVESF